MSFYDTAEFIEAFRNGGCFMFEADEGDPDVTEEDPEDTSLEETEGDDTDEATENTDADAEPPTTDDTAEDEVDLPDDAKESSADTVNTDEPSQSKQSLTADQIAEEFKKTGALKMTVAYAMKSIGKTNKVTLKMLMPYIKAGIEKFCQKQEFITNVSEMAKAVMVTLKSLDANEVQKEKMKAAQAKKAAEQKETAQQSKESEGGAPEDGGDEAPAPDEGGEDVAPPDEGGAETPENEEA